jgi:acyl-CoA thioesterase I
MSLCSLAFRRSALLCVMALFATADLAKAEPVRIVVIGASNAAGTAVGSSAAWPAQLENMLRAKGYDVSMSVRAVAGAGSAQVLAQAASIPSGTAVVVYDMGRGNDRDAGASPEAMRANRAQIEARIRAAGAKPVAVNYTSILGPEGSSAWIAGDRHHHFTAQSHRRVATAEPAVSSSQACRAFSR